jgi:hypothetical protein
MNRNAGKICRVANQQVKRPGAARGLVAFHPRGPSGPDSKGGSMAATPLSDETIIDRACKVFYLGSELAKALDEEHHSNGSWAELDPKDFQRRWLAFEEFAEAVVELLAESRSFPVEFATLAQILDSAGEIVKQIREISESADAKPGDYPPLQTVINEGREELDYLTGGGLSFHASSPLPMYLFYSDFDTEPSSPKPPKILIEPASRAIPLILSDVRPSHDGNISMTASELVNELQKLNHNLAVAQWAVHEAIQSGQLRKQLRRRYDEPPPNGPLPFEEFDVIATEDLWAWWRGLEENRPQAGDNMQHKPAEVRPKLKGRNDKGSGRVKLIASLTKHHQYANGSCLNQEPIGNNELAELADVSPSTASVFFNKQFRGHTKYKALCKDFNGLLAALKILNKEFTPSILYRGLPPDEDDRGENKED